jgi:DNA-binding Lrp family transcriptional regulator
MKTEFDRVDQKIIQLLHADARISASDVARALNANERTIRKRIDRLIRLGAIRLTAIVDPQVFGYIIAVDIFLEVDPENEERVIALFKSTPEISYIALGQGTRDISIECRFKNSDEMHQFLRKTLPAIDGVRVQGSSLVPRIIRNIDEWLPANNDFGNDNSSGEKP